MSGLKTLLPVKPLTMDEGVWFGATWLESPHPAQPVIANAMNAAAIRHSQAARDAGCSHCPGKRPLAPMFAVHH